MPTDPLTKQQEAELKSILHSLSLGNAFGDLIHQAIVNDWNPQQFVTQLVRDDRFQAKFPGVIGPHGEINDFLVSKEGVGLSPSSLGQALSNYRSLWQAYEQAGKRYGYGDLNRNQIATLIKGETSPDEFGSKAYALNVVTKNKTTFDLYNQQRKAAGLPPLERGDILSAIANQDAKFFDVYEATRLRQLGSNFGFNAKEAQAVAKAIPDVNAAGQPTNVAPDIGRLVAELSGHLSDIGPELRSAGIDTITLARYIANPSAYPRLAGKIEQVMAARRSQGAYVAGSQSRKGPAGGLALFEQDRSAAY